VCQSYLPSAVVNRAKRGFAGNVVDDWFRGAMDSKMADTFMDGQSHMYRYLKPREVQALFQDHSTGRNDNHKVLFSLIVFEEWLKAH
jgi:asparagine synthase (glutamine-hydrolysing)